MHEGEREQRSHRRRREAHYQTGAPDQMSDEVKLVLLRCCKMCSRLKSSKLELLGMRAENADIERKLCILQMLRIMWAHDHHGWVLHQMRKA